MWKWYEAFEVLWLLTDEIVPYNEIYFPNILNHLVSLQRIGGSFVVKSKQSPGFLACFGQKEYYRKHSRLWDFLSSKTHLLCLLICQWSLSKTWSTIQGHLFYLIHKSSSKHHKDVEIVYNNYKKCNFGKGLMYSNLIEQLNNNTRTYMEEVIFWKTSRKSITLQFLVKTLLFFALVHPANTILPFT